VIENIKFENSYLKQVSKLIKNHSLTKEQINNTIELYKTNRNDTRLYYHSICCKRDKHRKSIAVLGTNQQYKILFAEYSTITNFIFIGHHNKYDRLNKDC